MPAEQMGASHREYESFPNIVEHIGENPARWLDQDLIGVNNRAKVVTSLVRGMDSIARVRAWKAVERNPDVGPTEGPREGIIRLLDQREEWLLEHGERPDRLPHGPRRPPEMFDTGSEAVVRGEESPSAHQKLKRRRAATDGGRNE